MTILFLLCRLSISRPPGIAIKKLNIYGRKNNRLSWKSLAPRRIVNKLWLLPIMLTAHPRKKPSFIYRLATGFSLRKLLAEKRDFFCKENYNPFAKPTEFCNWLLVLEIIYSVSLCFHTYYGLSDYRIDIYPGFHELVNRTRNIRCHRTVCDQS